MSNCYKTSDNKHPECPPRMDDGRHFTDYRPNCHVNDLLRADNQISNSFQYRLFLQENAGDIMDKHRQIACSKNCCSPCGNGENFENTTMLPEKYIQECNENSCKILLNDVNGVGLGRKYYTYPNKHNSCGDMPNAWPVNQETNKCSSPLDDFSYYGAAFNSAKPNLLRHTVPKGGDAGRSKRVAM